MKITNKHELPEVFVRFLENDPYSKGESDFSVTELIDSPQISCLKHEHSSEIETDVSDSMFQLLGTAVHNVLQIAADEDDIVEDRIYVGMDGYIIGGQPDLIVTDTVGACVHDYKVTSVGSYQFNPDGKEEWHKQLNIYGWMVKEVYALDVDGLVVHTILRDWSSTALGRSSNYPEHSVMTIEIPRWEHDETEQYLKDRLKLHSEARKGNVPECSVEEMWERPTRYAVVEKTKDGSWRKRASVVLDDERAAYSVLGTKDTGKARVETRPGQRVRCESWCEVSQWCPQYKRYKSDE